MGLRGAGEGIQSADKDGNPAQDDQTNFQPSLLGLETAHTEAWPAAQSPRSQADQTSHAKDQGTGATRTDAERRGQGGHSLPREDAGSVQCQHRAGAPTSRPQTQGGAAEDAAHGGHHQPAPAIQVHSEDLEFKITISYLFCFSGLSIQPVSESASQLENVIKDVEQVYRILQEACNEV